MKSYMIALRGSHKEWNKQSPSEMQATMEKYFSWVDGLKKAEIFEYGLPLSGKAKILKSRENHIEIVDGPYAESKEALTGFFVIKATSLDNAAEIARECPALQHGEEVDVIEVGDH